MKIVLTTLNAKYTHSSVALRYLRAYCQPLPATIAVQEFSINQQVLDILGRLQEEQPDIVGFACYIWNIEMTVKIAYLLKKVLPKVRIICGGPEVSYQAAEFLAAHSAIDYLVLGEGEESLYSLLQQLEAGRTGWGIPAIAYRDEMGRIAIGSAAVVADLNSIPFPYSATDIAVLQEKIIYYESSRGCPFSCQYCLSSATSGVRFFPLQRVIAELNFFISHKVRQVKFVDRTFNAKKEHYLPIWKFLTKQNCQTNFHFEVAVDLMDEEVLAVLAKMPAGRIQLEIGVQSTNPATLQKIRRTNHWEKIVANVTRLRSFGTMHLHLDLIIGLPEEDYASFQRSFNDVYRLQPQMLQIGFLKLLKGSGITKSAAAHDYIFMDTAPYQVLANRYMPYEEMRKLQIFEEVFEQYYNGGRFRSTSAYLIGRLGGDAFCFYEQLTEYWQNRGLHTMAHSAKSLYAHLFAFCRQNFAEQLNVVQELLKLDALTVDRGGILPDFLPWSETEFYEQTTAFWRSDRVRRYLPDYQFTNWRELKKRYHIEVFAFSIETWRKTGTVSASREAVLFSYADGAVEYQTIAAADFKEE